jgi:glycosyltransferase involved in cell wall biosynthesis
LENLNIAFVHFWTLRLPRGVETLTLSLANALARQGHSVSILCARRMREPLVAPLPQVRVQEFPTFRYFEAATIVPFYAQALLRGRYDVVVTFFADFGEGRAFQWVAPFIKFKHVLYLTFPVESAPHRYDAYKKFGWDKRADVLLADAAYTARTGAEFFGRPVQVLPSGTDPARFMPDAKKRAEGRARFGFGADQVVLLNVAALEKRKGAWRVIEALPQLRAQCPNVRYLVMGGGPELEPLQARAEALGVSDVVVFGGTTNDLLPIYNAADIFVLLSDAEAGSIAVLEAMACGLPVVASASGGFDEVVTLETGCLVERDDGATVTGALGALAAAPEQRTEMGRAGRQRILKRFSWGSIAADFVQSVGDVQRNS